MSRRRRLRGLSGLILVLALFGVGLSVGMVRDQVGRAPTRTARVAPSLGAQASPDQRAGQVQRLLDRRASAVRTGDRRAFLATVDPAAATFRARQGDTFDALSSVPIDQWDYRLDPTSEQEPDVALDARYGAGTWWGPGVELGYTFTGVAGRPTRVQQHLTFVRRAGRWYVAAADDFAARGDRTPRQIWDAGPVLAVRRPGVLVLGHPGAAELLTDVARRTAAAVPVVSSVWGQDWSRQAVVLVPASAEEMAALLDQPLDLSQIAAVATAELRSGEPPAGERILVNPDTFSELGELGRRVVLTHELTHVATRAATGPATPMWLAEGLADYVAYQGLDLSLSVTARELRADVRAGRVPDSLPSEDAFESGSAHLASAYEQAWLATRLLVEQQGRDGFLTLYRSLGARRDVEPSRALEQTLQPAGTSTARFTADWRAHLEQVLR